MSYKNCNKPGCCPDEVIKQPKITKFGQGTVKTLSLRNK